MFLTSEAPHLEESYSPAEKKKKIKSNHQTELNGKNETWQLVHNKLVHSNGFGRGVLADKTSAQC